MEQILILQTGKSFRSHHPTGAHTRPMRMDFIFAKPDVLPYVEEFVMVREGLPRIASDHLPWYVILDKKLSEKG